ncbi:UDP-N-acetylglucosamine pyrophosphorylase [Actinomortierella ambigua]|uniref:UDP-N-acetylglucosamine diphosphorylase n=1 Tax=Actinomortierella ambigua TaxID=1343610 RepID=A0A9P6QGJ9_9FUNG|nr:UDP-N-acetylglucosamine pyrophosphorylase [Actinomortierella ambigua]
MLDKARVDRVHRQFEEAGQGHILYFWDSLSLAEQESFLEQLESIDPNVLNSILDHAMAASRNKSYFNNLTPLESESVRSVSKATREELQTWERLGLEAIEHQHVAVLLMAGGQGTRLGSKLPKGCFQGLGLPSRKTLFQIQAERILKLQQLATELLAKDTGRPQPKTIVVPWIIMTSQATRRVTESFLKDNAYFGLDPQHVIFFDQGVIPCFDSHGKLLLHSKHMLATAPNGNGGLYWALHKEGILDELERRGVQYVHSFSVDNILTKIADPVGIGYAIQTQADVMAKVVPKRMPEEPLGVICRLAGKIKVVEYSELDPSLAALQDPQTGELVYNAGYICNQVCSLKFLRRLPKILEDREQNILTHHVAWKKIPFVDTNNHHPQGAPEHLTVPDRPNGVKLEMFVFDVFPLAERFSCLQVPRSEEFSPVKNARGLDSPETARRDLEKLHVRWIEQAGGRVVRGNVVQSEERMNRTEDNLEEEPLGFELSPAISLAGEGLEWARDKKIPATSIETLDDVVL